MRRLRKSLFNLKPKINPLKSFGVIHFIPSLNCNSVNIAETGCTARIRLQENKRSLENYDCQSKITIHAINTDHVPNFVNLYFVNF